MARWKVRGKAHHTYCQTAQISLSKMIFHVEKLWRRITKFNILCQLIFGNNSSALLILALGGHSMKRLLLLLNVFVLSVLFSGQVFPQIDSISWTRGPDIPLQRGGYYGAWYNGGLVVAGGTYWSNKKKLWTDKVSFYDPKLNKWSELLPLPRPQAYGTMVESKGNLYLFGGTDENTIYKEVYRFDGKSWTKISEMPRPLIYTASAIIGSRVYLVGGGESLNDSALGTNGAWAYDIKSGKWETLAPTPGPPVLYHTVSAVGNSLYVFGGSTQESGKELTNLNNVYKFDTISKAWQAVNPAPVSARAWYSTSVGGQIYLFGGYTDHFLDDVYRYDPARDQYSLISHLPLRLCDAPFFYSKGRFFGATGEDNPGSRFKGMLIGRTQKKHR